MNRRVKSAGLCENHLVPFIGTVNASPPILNGGGRRSHRKNVSSRHSKKTVEWLIWDYIGSSTVSSLFNEKDFTRALGIKLFKNDIGPRTSGSLEGVEREIMELAIVRKAVAQILSALAGLHKIGIVHRDIKPYDFLPVSKFSRTFDRVENPHYFSVNAILNLNSANLLVANNGKGIRILDLGAAADLAEKVGRAYVLDSTKARKNV